MLQYLNGKSNLQMATQNTPYTGSDADACHYRLTMTLWAPPEEPFQARRIAPCIHQDSTQPRPVTNWCLFVPSQSSLQSVVKCRLLPKNTESRLVLHVCCTWYICNMPLIRDWKQRILRIEIGAIFAKFRHSVHHRTACTRSTISRFLCSSERDKWFSC